MCTVTYIPTQKGICITSNRDEKQTRLPAIPPGKFCHAATWLLYPKDATAGGTWIAAKANGDTAVLLNGGYVAHAPCLPYRQSRGRVVIDVLQAAEPIAALHGYNCSDMEPFTLILFSAGHLFECRWTGITKHIAVLNTHGNYIWSSATLYSPEVAAKRKVWFQEWLQAHPQPTQKEVMQFHRFGGDGDSANNLCMNRSGKMLTVSTTSVLVARQSLQMKYWDAVTGIMHTTDFGLTIKDSPVSTKERNKKQLADKRME